jgi:hypothetical protein
MKSQDSHTLCGPGSASPGRLADRPPPSTRPGATGPSRAYTSRASSDLGRPPPRNDSATAHLHPLERARTLPNLDARYGETRPARAKPGRSSGVQPQELERDGRSVRVHPELLRFSQTDLRAGEKKLTEQQAVHIHESLKDGQLWKYQVADKGDMALAPAKVKERLPTGEEIEVRLGHVTLVGGTPEPKGRLGGEMRFGPLKEGGEPVFFINNDSGRFSEYQDRNPSHLQAVAEDLKAIGLPEPQTQWIDMVARAIHGKPGKQKGKAAVASTDPSHPPAMAPP